MPTQASHQMLNLAWPFNTNTLSDTLDCVPVLELWSIAASMTQLSDPHPFPERAQDRFPTPAVTGPWWMMWPSGSARCVFIDAWKRKNRKLNMRWGKEIEERSKWGLWETKPNFIYEKKNNVIRSAGRMLSWEKKVQPTGWIKFGSLKYKVILIITESSV